MHIKPPGIPQQIEHQPDLHTFIGDTPQQPEPSDLELSEASFSAVRAYGELGRATNGNNSQADASDAPDIRSAPPVAQASWVQRSN